MKQKSRTHITDVTALQAGTGGEVTYGGVSFKVAAVGLTRVLRCLCRRADKLAACAILTDSFPL